MVAVRLYLNLNISSALILSCFVIILIKLQKNEEVMIDQNGKDINTNTDQTT